MPPIIHPEICSECSVSYCSKWRALSISSFSFEYLALASLFW